MSELELLRNLRGEVSSFSFMTHYRAVDSRNIALVWLAVALGFVVYLVGFQSLFHRPIQNKKEWVVFNGVFSFTKSSASSQIKSKSILSKKLWWFARFMSKKPTSVADELRKWAKLRDDDIVTAEEYERAKSELLSK